MKATTAMLADDAINSEGKLYIHGGGWDTIVAGSWPVTIARIALVFTIEVEPHEFQIPHTITVELVDQDYQPYGIKAAGVVQAAGGPLAQPGTSTYVPHVLRFEQNIVIQNPGSFRFLIKKEGVDEPLAAVPLHVIAAPIVATTQ